MDLPWYSNTDCNEEHDHGDCSRLIFLNFQIAVIACLAVVAIADKAPHPPPPAPYHPPPAPYHPPHAPYHSEPHYPDVPPKYAYNYGISDDYGVNLGHSESRDGYKTEGSYTVDLPDGRKQTVKYVDNGDGLVAEVSYEGEAHYPEHTPAYKPAPPAYAPPPPAPYE
ncbi:cuticle protein 7-like [Penaeus vannamei]|uniref:cuticle protein 7-like n=1 Tax=Penaeus vannamei TaxID=6689 RepID=UPI00387F6D4A